MPFKKKIRISEQAPQILIGRTNVQGPQSREEEKPKTGNDAPSTGKGAFGETLSVGELARRQAKIKSDLDRTKGVSPGQTTAEDVISRNPELQKTQEQRIEAQEAAGKIGEQVAPSEILPEFSEGDQATIGGIARVVGSGAAVGAGIGAFAGGVGAAPGAIIGGGAAAIGVLFGVLAADRKQSVRESFTVFRTEKGKVYPQILNLANNPEVSRSSVVDAYNQHIANVKEAERRISVKTAGKEGNDLAKAQDELYQIRQYLSQEPIRIAELTNALNNPDPSKFAQSEDVVPEEAGVFEKIF